MRIDKFSPQARFNENTVPHTLLNPRILTIEKKLGEGGFGAVYKVKDPEGHIYALKILLQANPEILEDEIKTLVKISASPACNPDMVCYIDSFRLKFEGKETFGILTDFINGIDLRKCMYDREYTFSPGEVMTVAYWLAPIIEALHDDGYVHRDLKPANIMIQENGRLKLIDFGLACRLSKDSMIDSCVGDVSGTPGFMAPEITDFQFRSNPKKYYKTADIFAFGATLYNLLTGKKPYDLVDFPHLGSRLVPPYKGLSTGYPCLDRLIKESVDLNPDKRPTATKVVEYIQECYDDHHTIVKRPRCFSE